MNQHRPRLLHCLLYSLLLCGLLPTSHSTAGAVRASPLIQPTAVGAAAGAEPVEFLRNLPGLAGLTEDADHLISGGGFLYWAKCQPDGPNRQGAAASADSAGSTGYLRRWPLGGGLPLTLSPLAFCETDLWAADESGLYYWQNGALYRRSAAAPLNPVIVTTTARPAGNLVLSEQLLYWAVGGTLWQVPKGQSWVAGGRDDAETMAETGAVFSNLMVSGSQIQWSADGQIRAVDKSCIVQCTVNTLVNEAGLHLADARATGPAIGTTISPHWVAGPYDFYQGFQFTGRDIRGYQCTTSPLGNSCAAATLYAAPDRSDSTGTVRPPTLGALSTDGQFLFWIENLKNCVTTPFGRTCSDSDAGRLMKWRLQRTVLNNDPFLTPQPIASKNSGGAFSIRGTGAVQSAGGWLYFLTSNGLSRLRADAAPLQWDLAYQAMEVTQGIQNLANQVPLVANKPTVVRVYQRKLSGPNLYGVRARLHGARNGATLPGSPLQAANGALALTQTNATLDRMKVNDSWLFQLPTTWTDAGTIQLAVQIDPREEVNDPNRSNNSSGGLAFTFTGKAPICLVTVPVRTHAPAARHDDPSLLRMVEMMRQLVPARDIWLFHQDHDVAQLEARFGLPPWQYTPYALPRKGENVLNALQERDLFSDDPDQCDEAGAITHYVGLVHADTPTVEGNSESFGLGRRESPLPPTVSWVKLMQPWQFVGPDNTNQRVNTLVHELTHNYGRRHINCGGPANTDGAYPYLDAGNTNCTLDDGRRNGTTIPTHERYYGFDLTKRKPITPDGTADFISYGSPYWVSDYTWKALFSRLNTTGRVAQSWPATQAGLAGAGVVYAFGVIDPAQKQATLDYLWNLPSRQLSQGMLRKAAYHIATPYTAQQLNAQGGNYHLRLRDSAGQILADQAITLAEAHAAADNGPRTFSLTFPAPAGVVTHIELLDGEQLLANIAAGSNAPTVAIVSPTGGETIADNLTVSWQASDPDREDRLTFNLQYSPDDGQHWRALLTKIPSQNAEGTNTVALTTLAGLTAANGSGRLRIIATDGYHTTIATSNRFSVTNRKPQPYIVTPDDQPLPAGQGIVIRGGATDPERGAMTGDQLQWTLDGAAVGTGAEFTLDGLAPGTYTLQLTATDGDGGAATVSRIFTVAPLMIAQATTTPLLDGRCDDDAYAAAAQLSLAPYTDGTQVTVQLVGNGDLLYACFTGMARTTGTSPGTLAVLHIDSDASRDSSPGANDYVFYLSEGGVVTSYVGNGSDYAPITDGAAGQVSATTALWHGELRIDRSVLGGWNRVIGIAPEQIWINSAQDVYFWPHTAAHGNPATWGRAVLGSLPQISHLAPEAAGAGSAEQTIRIDGSGFAENTQALWQGTPRPTTVISATQLQMTIAAADLATPGAYLVGVQNYGNASATANRHYFTVHQPAPRVTSASLVGNQLTVNGANFVAASTILWNGEQVTPTVQSATQLQATLQTAQLSVQAFATITVHTPGPGGGSAQPITLASGAPAHVQFLPFVTR